jgi:hypothetical protein
MTAVVVGVVRLHALGAQLQLMASAAVSQNDRILGMSNALLLLPLPVMLVLLWSTKFSCGCRALIAGWR